MSYEQPPRGRLARLFEAAGRRHVPLRTILVTAGVVVATYLAGKLLYLLRDIVLLMLVAGFVAMLLSPAVDKVQRRVPRRGPAVTIVTLWSVLVFLGLAAAFGYPLANGITHLADRLPGYIASAQHGTGWIGHLRKEGGPVTSNYVRVTGLAGLFAEARELSVTTVIFDVEPLVAPWRGSQESLDQGIARILGDARTVPSVRAVIFATNSPRRPTAVPARDGLQVRYLSSAGKPLRTAPYRDLPRPGAVAGDQLPTDGILAYRLGYTFLHYMPELAGVPLGPALMHRWGELVRPVLFRRPAAGR